MAHWLGPEPGLLSLDPSEVVRRLREVFAYVDEDREAGTRHVDQKVAQLQRMNAPSEVIERSRRKRVETIHVVVTDDPSSEVAYLSFTIIPGEPILIGYHSQPHEDAAQPVLERCAQALEYIVDDV